MRDDLHTPWSDEIVLISYAKKNGTYQDAQGYAVGTETRRTVICTFEDGVSQGEFYSSLKEGLQASASVEVWTVDYQKEKFVEFHGTKYEVIRAFQSSFDCTTLILSEAIR